MGILAGFMVPHPPMIVPEVGRESEERVIPTKEAYEKVAMAIQDLEPEVLAITSPHSVMYADYFHISPGEDSGAASGHFSPPPIRCMRRFCRMR